VLTIAILAVPQCILSTVTGPVDILSMANQIAAQYRMREGVFCHPLLVSKDGTPVTGFNGISIPSQYSFADCPKPDLVIVPGVYNGVDQLLEASETIAWVRERHAAGACICSVCAGSFVLAEAGILNGREATTHWVLADRFRQRNPQVKLLPEAMLVDGGDYVCAGGVSAFQDLCLHLLSRFASPELATLCRKILLLDPVRQSQVPYRVTSMRLGHGDEAVSSVQRWLHEHFMHDVSVPKLAQIAKVGERTLLRRFHKSLGETPSSYVQRLRIEAARSLLESTTLAIEEITRQIGYEDISSFRRLFREHTSLTPTQYRKRYALRP